MADKLTQLTIDALTRAAAEPAGLPLFAGRTEPGLFPGTATAKPAARRCLDDGLLRELPAGHGLKEHATITEKGLKTLLELVSPKQVLEDFVRVLESRQDQLEQLVTTATRMAENLAGMRAAVSAVLPVVTTARIRFEPDSEPQSWATTARGTATANVVALPSVTDIAGTVLTHLQDWSTTAGAANDCPLSELFRAVACGHAGLGLGTFHDALRLLYDAGRIYLHPWTGPLYAVPEPTFALLVGHNVAYYASLRHHSGRTPL